MPRANELMKPQSKSPSTIRSGAWLILLTSLAFATTSPANQSVPLAQGKATEAIPWDQIGAKAGADYQGDGLMVQPTETGARLRCVFQRLEGEASPDGLWLTSTVADQRPDRFRVTAVHVGRATLSAPEATGQTANLQPSTSDFELGQTGIVGVDGQTVQFKRPGLIEEYSVSMDGVRQDFVVLEKPIRTTDNAELKVNLNVSGAHVQPTPQGAQLVLNDSGRKIAYTRLKVTDASGKELPARIEVTERSEIAMAILVNDTAAAYPIRIDPTFSDANWISMNSSILGADGLVLTAAVDGSGNLYIGGDFIVVGDVIANRIAKWDGTSWSALGAGANGTVRTLAVSGSDVYAGGDFTTVSETDGLPLIVNRIAKWNGNSWGALGSGMNHQVLALAVSGSDLYAGGWFTSATNSGGVAIAANRVARWNGSNWSVLGVGMNGIVRTLAASGGDLYAGGDFTTAGGSVANRIAKWDGTTWSALGLGLNGFVSAVAVLGSDVYAGGNFTTATNSGGVAITANRIARWNGSSWSTLGSGLSDGVAALAASGSDVFVGGYFLTATNTGGVAIAARYIAKWNGSSWSALGSGGTGGNPSTLVVFGSNLYVGGAFETIGGVVANRIGKWDGSTWRALGSGVNGGVEAVAVSGSNVYVGGTFTTMSSASANYVAKWDGNNWSSLGSGPGGRVKALAVSGSSLYAGGGGLMRKWDGSGWSTLGSGVNGSVEALVVSGSDLYAAGNFTTAGGVVANRIAKWNGTSWSALGSGLDGAVYALAASEGNVYVGGYFSTATNGGAVAVPANKIAKWNGSSWSALGSGLGYGPNAAFVFALTVAGGDVIAGGQFTTATNTGGVAVPVNYIARWNGSSWSAMSSGMNGSVYAMAVLGNDLYAGGVFTTAGGSAANRIAKWDGNTWSALGSGMNYSVESLALMGGDLYAGGYFTTAGGKISVCVARAVLPVEIITQPASQSVQLSSNALFTVNASGSAPLFYQWSFDGSPISNATNSSLTVSNVTFANQGNYSVIITNTYGSVTSSVAALTLISGTIAVNDTLAGLMNGALTNLTFQLLTNDLLGTLNGSNSSLSVIHAGPTTSNGGSIQLQIKSVVPAWTNYYNGPGNAHDAAGDIALDSDGNVFVAGYSSGVGSSADFFIIKYSNSGAVLWTNRYNGSGNGSDGAGAIAVDTNGNVFAAGSSTGIGSLDDFTTIKYSNAGIPLWTNRYNGPGNDIDGIKALALDTNGNVLVTGFSQGNGSQLDFATIKYSNSGLPLWTNRYNGPGNGDDRAWALAVDGNGNVFVTGHSWTGSQFDYITIKYSDTGVALWTNRYNGPGNSDDRPQALAVDSGGNVIVTGYSTGSGSGEDYATIKYSGAGVALWTNRFNGPGFDGLGNGGDRAWAMVVGGSGNVFVTGYSAGTGSYDDYATVAYSGSGVPLWTNRYNGPDNNSDVANIITLDASGNVYVSGESSSIGGLRDFVTIAYSSTGAGLWTNRYDGPLQGDDVPNASAVDNRGNLFITGRSKGPVLVYDDWATLKLTSGVEVNYTAPLGFIGTDTFSYEIMDGLGMTATGTVSVVVAPDPQFFNRTVLQPLPGGLMRFSYLGLSGATYVLDRSFSLFPAQWIPVATNVAEVSGAISFTNAPVATANNYWRVRAVPLP